MNFKTHYANIIIKCSHWLTLSKGVNDEILLECLKCYTASYPKNPSFKGPPVLVHTAT